MSQTNGSVLQTAVMDAPIGIVNQVLNSITKDDIVAIYVQEYTDKLIAAKLDGEARLRGLDAAVQKLQAKMEQIGPRLGKTLDLKAAEKAARALSEAGFGKFIVEVSEGTRDDERKLFSYSIEIVNPKSAANAYDRTLVSLSQTVKFNDEAHEIVREQANLRRQIGAVQGEIIAIKKKISDIPNQQMRTRANLAKVSISRDAQGAALLESFKSIKALPME